MHKSRFPSRKENFFKEKKTKKNLSDVSDLAPLTPPPPQQPTVNDYKYLFGDVVF